MVAVAKRDDPLSTLAKQDKSRLAELIPLRYGRMSRTPFTFLRGAAAVMASDLAAGSRTDLWVELCGDAHPGNFRWYHAPDRELVFDLNDFDGTPLRGASVAALRCWKSLPATLSESGGTLAKQIGRSPAEA